MKGAWRIHTIAAGLGCLVACEDPGETPGPDAAQARCSPTAMFGRRTDHGSLNTAANEEQPALSPDELTLYFSRDDDKQNYDIYQSTRASRSASFGTAVPVPGVNTADEDREPRVTADGLAMFATSRTIPSGKFRVTFATRASTGDPFGPLQPVPTINGTANDSDPFISADGRTLYFSSDRTGNFALYRSTRTGAVFSAPELIPGTKLDTVYSEQNPVLTDDELTIYFSSSRPNLGQFDIFEATRASVQDPFGEPVNVAELNGVNPEAPSWISPDNCELYFTHFDAALGFQIASSLRGR